MSEVSMFRTSGKEKQKENAISNFCGTILKMIYNEKPSIFEEIINDFIKDSKHTIQINPIFKTQEKLKDSIPDIILEQESFNIIFEVKLYDWFETKQLIAHIAGMKEKKAQKNILFLMGANFIEDNIEKEFGDVIKEAGDDIGIYEITFEDFKNRIDEKKENFNDTLKDLIEELGILFDSENLLESWEHQLDIVNTSDSYDDFLNRYYICPNIGRAYKHKKCKYLGAYNNKNINAIAEIDGVVIRKKNGEYEVKYNTGIKINEENMRSGYLLNTYEESNKNLISEAEKITQKINNTFDEYDEYLVFILKESLKCGVNCQKKSSGGMQGSKMYIDVKDVNSIDDLYKRMKDKEWDNKADLETIIRENKF